MRFFFSPSVAVSLLTFRFGAKRQFDLSATGVAAFDLTAYPTTVVFGPLLSFSMILL